MHIDFFLTRAVCQFHQICVNTVVAILEIVFYVLEKVYGIFINVKEQYLVNKNIKRCSKLHLLLDN